MTTSWKTAALVVCAILVSTTLWSGCGMNRRYVNDAIRQMAHSDVAIEYQVHESAVRPAGAEANEDGSAALAAKPHTLSLVYPHPSPHLGRAYAQVTLRETTPDGTSAAENIAKGLIANPFLQRERASAAHPSPDGDVMQMIVKRDEVEFLLRDLAADGFFDRERRDGGIELSVTLGSRSHAKTWDRIAALDRLAARVREQNRKEEKPAGHAPKDSPLAAQLLAPSGADEVNDEPVSDRVELVPDPAKF